MSGDMRPRFIGARVQRLEDPRLLTGHGNYVSDHKAPGLLHVAIRRSDHPHARLDAVDTGEARAMKGVAAVLTADELRERVRPVLATSRIPGYQPTPILPLADGKLHYVGQPVAAVLAESRYLAEDAAAHIAMSVTELAALTDPEAAAARDAPLLHDGFESNVLAVRSFARGEVDDAFAGAAHVVGGRFRFRRKSPTPIEARACMAAFDPGTGKLTLHSSTQVPGIIRDALCEILDMPGHRVRVVAPDVGGGFGAKTSLYPEEILVAAAARMLARPVKWVSDRLEDLVSTSQSFDEIVDAELALDAEGNILGLRAEVTGDAGAGSIYPWTAAIEPVQVVSFLPGPYRMPAYGASARAVATTKPPMGPYRGVGRPIAAFVMERLIDLAAQRLGHDPKAMRLRNLVGDDEFPYRTGSGIIWDRSEFLGCLTSACDAIGYQSLRAEQRKARAEGRWMGIGIASYAELTGIGSRIAVAPGMPINTGSESAAIQIDSTGAVTARFGIASQGQGLETTLAQVVAETLGVAVGDVRVIHGDTDAVTHGTGTYASRSAVLAGGAATLAAELLKKKVVRVAAHLLEAAEADIETGGGRVYVAGTDRSLSFRELARAVYSEMGRLPRELQDEIGSLEATRTYDPYFGTATAACHVAVVDVDAETCRVKVRRYVVAEDCGRIINPLIADGQAHGGVAQGIGAALYEEMVHDDAGQVLTASLVDYVVPSAGEIPPMEVIHLETVAPNTVGGFRGLGEGGTIGAPAAVANAVADALAPFGIEISELPVTPERLFRLLKDARS